MAGLPRLNRETAQPGADALEALSTSVLILDARHYVTTANRSARALFGDPAGEPLADVLDGAEKRGLLARGGAGAILAMFSGAGQPPAEVETADGRVLACRLSPLGELGFCFELADVTASLQRASSRHRDPLTGLSNRTDFLDRLSQYLTDTTRTGEPVAVLYLDLDRFKSVNDTLGHPIGDALLKLVTDRMSRTMHAGDVLARLGGDEFAILQAAGKQPEAAEALARRLIDLVGRAYLVKGHMINVGVSIGIALSSGDTDAEDPLKRADLALMRAKETRGTLCFYHDEMDLVLQARRQMEVDLRRALVLQEFSLAYQPQVSSRGQRLVGFEALLRWQHPERGPVSPGQFIPLAEEIGLIVPLGEWALRTACREAASWPENLSVAVNLSPVQFRVPSLVQVVVSALANAGLAPGRLDLEITEGALLDDTAGVLATLTQLRTLGVRISMDDFGTGYSSLTYLQKFPFNKIKIDQSFVRRIVEDLDSAAIVRAVAALGNSLGMTTVAEGVESPEQLARVQAEGCAVVQGYFTGKPLTPEAASALAHSQAQTPQDDR